MCLDVSAFTEKEFSWKEGSFHWPTSNEDYTPWSFIFPVRIRDAIERSPDIDVKIAANSVFSDIARDASRIACAVADIHAATVSGANIILDERISPIAAWVNGECSLPKKISDILSDCSPKEPGERNWKSSLRSLKRTVQTLMTRAEQRLDIQSINNMVSWVIAKDGTRTPVFLYPDLLPFTDPGESVPSVDALTHVLISDFRGQLRLINDFSSKLLDRAVLIFGLFLNERISQVYGDVRAYKDWRRKARISNSLLGGTPKVSGRLLGSMYREEGRHVARCSHGGDRGFFDDPLWAFSELLEADEYWVHGPKEASNITQRLAKQRIVRPSSVPQIRAAGSPFHVARFRHDRDSKTLQRDGKRVVLVAGLFSGEWNHLTIAFKPPDPLIADLQVSLLRLLKKKGHYVIVRPHPKGLLPRLGVVESFYVPHCDEIIMGSFNPHTVNADVLIFDFAGSAWFDAMASRKGILLVDTGDRPFDPEGVIDLKERCAVVRALRVEGGGYYLIPEELESGIEEAISKSVCTDKFAHDYFGVSLV